MCVHVCIHASNILCFSNILTPVARFSLICCVCVYIAEESALPATAQSPATALPNLEQSAPEPIAQEIPPLETLRKQQKKTS